MINRLIISLVLLMVFTGCTKEVENENQVASQELEEVLEQQKQVLEGGRIIVSSRLPKTLNPLLNEDTSVDNILKLIFEPLVILDEDLKPYPNLANSLEYSENDNSIIVKLKQNIYWTNGDVLTAYDVAFSIDTLKRDASADSIYKENIKNLASNSYQILDNYTIKINFNVSPVHGAYSLMFPIIPNNYYNKPQSIRKEIEFEPVGNGAFKLLEYKNVKGIELEKNTSYFKGTPIINNIGVLITEDIETDFYAFNQNIIDVISAPLTDWSKYMGIKGVNSFEFLSNNYDFIGFNLQNSNLSNKKIRQSIAHGLNVDEIIKEVYLEHAVKTLVPINPNSWLYETELPWYETDINKAIGLIEESGYTRNNEGIFVSNETEEELFLNILVNQENEEKLKIARALSNKLKDIGIISEIVSKSFSEYRSDINNKSYDIFIGEVKLSDYVDLNFLFDSKNNYFSYKSEAIDIQFNSFLSASSEEVYKRNISNIQKTIVNDIPLISLAFKNSAIIVDEDIRGIENSNDRNVYFNIQNWYLETEKIVGE